MANPGNTPVNPRFNPGTTSNQQSVISNQFPIALPSLSPAAGQNWLELLLRDCGRVELRRVGKERRENRSQWFSDGRELWRQAVAWGGDVYCSLNRPRDGVTGPLRDADVERYSRLLFDVDPVRPTGTAATAEQIRDAVRLRDDLVQRLHAMGWPEPALALSGNGAHAVYRVDIPPTAAGEIRALYHGLRDRVRGAGAVLDTTTYNPARICRFYGLMNQKAGRVATVEVPPEYRLVPERALRLAMDAYKPRPVAPAAVALVPRVGIDTRAVDVVQVFQSAGLYRFAMRDGKHSVICPWAGTEHGISSTSDAVIWERNRNGYPAFYCSHDHCRGRWLPHALNRLGVSHA